LVDFVTGETVPYYVGELTILAVIIYLLYTLVWKRLLRPPTSMRKYGLTSKGSAWAVVTGASDGIGRVFALELAKKGFNLILISRTMSKIEAVSSEIESKYGVKTKGLAVDFASPDKSYYQTISDTITHTGPIGILVNNVGINYSFPAKLLDQTQQLDNQIVDVNINSLNTMTRLVLPEMIKNKRGGIINLSSFSGRIPAPMLATYSGTKAYVDYYSNALAAEYANQGINVMSIAPGLVTSNMSQVKRPKLIAGIVSPEPVVRSALNNLAYETKWTGHWVHSLQEVVMSLVPLSFATNQILSIHLGIRIRALKKQNAGSSRSGSESQPKAKTG